MHHINPVSDADFAHGVKEMCEHGDEGGVWYYELAQGTESRRWAVVVGPDDEEEADDGPRARAKVAYIEGNAGIWCDYDVDWMMPYSEETGDCWDTDTVVTPTNAASVLVYLLEEFDAMVEAGVLD